MTKVDSFFGHLSEIAWRKMIASAFGVIIAGLLFIAATGRTMVESAVDGRIRDVSAERVIPVETRVTKLEARRPRLDGRDGAYG